MPFKYFCPLPLFDSPSIHRSLNYLAIAAYIVPYLYPFPLSFSHPIISTYFGPSLNPCKILANENYIAVLCWILLVLFTILHIIVTVTKIIHYQKRSIADKEIILNTLIIISFFLITFHSNPLYHTEDVPCLDENLPCFASKITLGRYQYHAAGIGVALTWLMQMYFLAKVPRFGKYIEMFTSVSLTFLNLLFAFIFFLFAFTLSFYILFPGYDAFDTALPAVLVKVSRFQYDYKRNQDCIHNTELC